MTHIINPSQIRDSTVKITCNGSQGTGFFVSDIFIITAYHVVMDNISEQKEINLLKYDSTQHKGVIAFLNEDYDIAIIEVVNSDIKHLPLISSTIKINEKWESFGFPYEGESDQLRIYGKVDQILIGRRSDFILSCESIDSIYNYDGLSGAPIVIDGKVVGIILEQIDNKISAISVSKIKSFLTDIGFVVEDEYNFLELPSQFAEEIKASTPNYNVLKDIEEKLSDKASIYVLQGNPGSGKSTVVASFVPSDEKMIVTGRYFVKVPNDENPIELRSSKRYFLEWFENLISQTLYKTSPPVEDIAFEKKIGRLAKLLMELDQYYLQRDQIGVILIDGLDDVHNLVEFLGIIPTKLYNKIKFLYSCTSINILPQGIKSKVKVNQVIDVTPIELGQCEALIARDVGENVFPIEFIQRVASKSEGHALYLRYLINLIKSTDPKEINENYSSWINNFPAIDGNIVNYYNSIWDKIKLIPEELWVIIILAQLRQPVSKEVLIKMLPDEYKLGFVSHFDNLRYLLTGSSLIEIYHQSFKVFIKGKTLEYDAFTHDKISNFCENNLQDDYSKNNIVYHYSFGSNIEKSISYCNQEWADMCALNSVYPDLVLADIKQVISICINKGLSTSLIRLMLLLQRVEFRYDSVFAENASNIAKALIALRKPEDAIKYIVREDTLLVNNSDAILFLQLLYESNAKKQAEELLEAIHARFRRLMKEGLNTDEGIEWSTFMVELQALLLSTNSDFEKGFREYNTFMEWLRKLQDSALDSDNQTNYNFFYSLREYGSSWTEAYILRRFDWYAPSKKVSEDFKIPIDNKWAKMKATSANLYIEINHRRDWVEKGEKYNELIEEIEYLIVNYGFSDSKIELQILISALINESKNTKLVEELINKYLKFENETPLRKSNNVDIDYNNLHNLYFKYKVKGYIDSKSEYPTIPLGKGRYKFWEQYLVGLIQQLAFLEGKAYRLGLESNLNGLKDIKTKYYECVNKLDFTFDERTYWNGSYQIPESILPIIYSKIISFYVAFNSDNLNVIIGELINKANDQLGLYSEGYRECLFEIAQVLLQSPEQNINISHILRIYEMHIINGVKNRWERVSELLEICELYGRNNNLEDGNRVYMEVIASSMGPSWYKESQLGLINTTLDLGGNDKVNNQYVRNFAEILDKASGEMTFQRYVRNDKEEFVGKLASLDRLAFALDYFKFEILPPPAIVILNAEQDDFDAPRLGDGYNLGARLINETSAILSLLENITHCSLNLQFALSEMFVINDDTFRYVNRFGTFHAKLLNEMGKIKSPNIDLTLQKILHIVKNQEMENNRNEYLRHLQKNLVPKLRNKLKKILLENNIDQPLSQGNGDYKSSKARSRDRFYHLNRRCKKGIYENVETLIHEIVQAFNIEKISIWYDNFTSSADTAKENLKQLFTSDSQILKALANDINNFNTESWDVVSDLIWFMQGKIEKEKIALIFEHVKDHFTLLVDPGSIINDKYEWIDNLANKEDNDKLLVKFIIWILNHPCDSISKHAYDALLSLCEIESELTVPILLEQSLSTDAQQSTSQCSFILKDLSFIKPEAIVGILKERPEFINDILSIKHFTILKNYYDISINLNKINFLDLYLKLKNLFPLNIIVTGEVYLDEDYLDDIEYELRELNSLQILNGKFANDLLLNISQYCDGLSVQEYIKSDGYLKRSFYTEQNPKGRFQILLKHALNVAITPRVDQKNLNDVFEILN